MSRDHRAKYLLLCGSEEAPRALLFNGQHQFLTEMIEDDGFMLGLLLKAGKACTWPLDSLLRAMPPWRGLLGPGVRCYALD